MTSSLEQLPKEGTGNTRWPCQGCAGRGKRGATGGDGNRGSHVCGKTDDRKQESTNHWEKKHPQSDYRPAARHPKSLRIETENFHSMHTDFCRAAKYKVHRPGCHCSKMIGIRKRIMETNTDRSGNVSELLDGLHLSSDAKNNGESSGGGKTNTDNKSSAYIPLHRRNKGKDPFDGLTVVPETKTIPAVYVCLNTDRTEHSLDPRGCERKLQSEIFGTTDTIEQSHEHIPSFKVSCAACLLDDEPNGFMCIASSSLAELNVIAREAADVADRKRLSNALRTDHAHYVCAMEAASLQLYAGKTPQKSKEAVISQLRDGGVDVEGEIDARVEMGHHLTSLLRIAKRQKNEILSSLTHWMVIVYKDGPGFWTIDLPGGKRHLGESTLEGAVRETEEECSLTVDSLWISDSARILRVASKSDRGNAFFVVEPPPREK